MAENKIKNVGVMFTETLQAKHAPWLSVEFANSLLEFIDATGHKVRYTEAAEYLTSAFAGSDGEKIAEVLPRVVSVLKDSDLIVNPKGPGGFGRDGMEVGENTVSLDSVTDGFCTALTDTVKVLVTIYGSKLTPSILASSLTLQAFGGSSVVGRMCQLALLANKVPGYTFNEKSGKVEAAKEAKKAA